MKPDSLLASETKVASTAVPSLPVPLRGPSRSVRLVLLTIGWLNVSLGVAGAFLPLVPTTVFLLIALWCFMRCSPPLAARLYANARFGPLLRRWHEEGVIPIFAKIGIATSLSATVVGMHLLMLDMPVAKWAATAVCLAVLVYLLSRPHTPQSAMGMAVATAD